MTAPTGLSSGVGFRYCQLFSLDSDGYPAVTGSGSAPYAGVTISGAKAMTLNDPEPRQIVHTGDDRVLLVDNLPPLEPVSGELRTGKTNLPLDALLLPQHIVTLGETRLFGVGTDRRGDELQVGLLAYRQALEADLGNARYGRRIWEGRLINKALLISREGNFDENPEERIYTIRPQFARRFLWGTCFENAVDGYTIAQIVRTLTEYKPKILAWRSDGETTVYNFPAGVIADAPASKTSVWVEGVLQSEVTKNTSNITFATAPANNARIVALIEVQNEPGPTGCV